MIGRAMSSTHKFEVRTFVRHADELTSLDALGNLAGELMLHPHPLFYLARFNLVMEGILNLFALTICMNLSKLSHSLSGTLNCSFESHLGLKAYIYENCKNINRRKKINWI